MGSPLFIVGILAGLAAALETRALVKRRSAMVVSYWFVMLFISLALIVRSEYVAPHVDRLAGVPHVSRHLANSFGVLVLCAAQNAVYTSLISQRHMHRQRAVASASTTAVLLAMTILFAMALPLEPARENWYAYEHPPLAAYRFIFLGYLGISFSVVSALWARYAFKGNSARIRVAFILISSGGAIGTLWVINDLGIVLRALDLNPVSAWGSEGSMDSLLAFAVLLVLVGATFHSWVGVVDRLRKHVTFLELRALWRVLLATCPEVALLPQRPLWRDLVGIGDSDFRLRRQVTEIRDARLLLQRRGHPQAYRAADEVATHSALSEADRVAFAEAVLLWSAIHSIGLSVWNAASGSSPMQVPAGTAEDLWQEAEHLKRVAHFYRQSGLVLQATESLTTADATA